MRSGRIRWLYLFVSRAIKHCSDYRGISLLSAVYKIVSKILLSRLTPSADEINEDQQGGFQCTDKLHIIYSAFITYLRKNGNTVNQCMIYLYTSRKLLIQLGGLI